MAPEVFTDPYTKMCDIWSLGVIVYQILECRLPFTGENYFSLMNNIKKGDYPKITNKNHIEYKNIAEQCLKTDPNQRLNISEIFETLEKINKQNEQIKVKINKQNEQIKVKINKQNEQIKVAFFILYYINIFVYTHLINQKNSLRKKKYPHSCRICCSYPITGHGRCASAFSVDALRVESLLPENAARAQCPCQYRPSSNCPSPSASRLH
jgi:serine/threonine protein kinase